MSESAIEEMAKAIEEYATGIAKKAAAIAKQQEEKPLRLKTSN